MTVRDLRLEDAEACDTIIASLPDWFGLEEGIRDCAQAVRRERGLVIERDGSVAGFLTVVERTPAMSEITWLAVRADLRGRGLGTRLVEALVADLRSLGARLLLVQTLSDREDPGPEYAQTRAFYLARGFVPAAELEGSPDNPIQLMSRNL
jgi:N-acetylglutamate synthase-like GNAT family acetyltransferase